MFSVLLEEEWVPALKDRLSLIRLQPRHIVAPAAGQSALHALLAARYPSVPCDESLQAGKTGYADLFVGNFLLPWCPDPAMTLMEWRRVLNPAGVLMVTMLGPDTLREIPPEALSPMILLDMHNLGDAMVQAGFQEPVLDVEHLTLVYRDAKKCLAELQAAGMLVAGCDERIFTRGEDGRISLSVEVVYAHAFAPVSQRNGDEVAVPVSEIVRRR